jgi:enoyl-CoA hydratase/carnithine racemase
VTHQNSAQTTKEAGSPASTDVPLVDRTTDGEVGVLTMQAAPYNLLGEQLTAELRSALGWAGNQGVRAVVLRSGLRHFSAGADLDGMWEAVRDVPDPELHWGMVELLRAFDQLPVPILASVHGTCVGGGLELALASDLVIASESAKIGSVEATVGLHPLMGAIQRITQRAGATRAKEMAILGRRYDARTLQNWGLINWVVPDEQLTASTMSLAHELAHGPTVAHAATKAVVSIAVSQGVAAADEAMAELQKPIYRSEDFKIGVKSYKEKGIGMAPFGGR